MNTRLTLQEPPVDTSGEITPDMLESSASVAQDKTMIWANSVTLFFLTLSFAHWGVFIVTETSPPAAVALNTSLNTSFGRKDLPDWLKGDKGEGAVLL